MKKRLITVGIVLAVLLAGCREGVITVKEFVAWHQNIGVHASWPAYQGSDRRFHHFAVFAFTDWYLFRVARQEIEMKDERPFRKDSAVSFSYYEVDPYDGFRKIEKKESPNQLLQGTPAKAPSSSTESDGRRS